MKNLTFKTNINCGGCVVKITPVLNGMEEICEWKADTASPQKTLHVVAEDDLAASDVIAAIAKAGFKAEKIDN